MTRGKVEAAMGGGGFNHRCSCGLHERDAETIAVLRAEAHAAHDRLVWECASMSWATDGRLSTGVGHAIEMIRRERARADAAEAKVQAVEALHDKPPVILNHSELVMAYARPRAALATTPEPTR